MPRSAAAVALVAVFSAVGAAAQPQGTQRLGRIYDSESGAAIAGARVEWLAAPEAEAAAPAAPSVSQSTDSRGAFQLGRAWDPGGTVVVSALGYRQRTLPWHDAEVNGWRIGLDRDPFALDEILVTAGGRARRRSEVAVPIETIEATEIHAAGAPSVDRLLAELPGLQVSAGVPTGSNLLIRGIGGARVLVLLDGRPAPGSLIENRDLSRMSLAGVERVEVVKGPLSSLYGSDALGGVVNVITRAPTRGFRIDGRVLSGGLGRRQADLTASGGGRLRFRITGAWRQEDQMPGVVSAVGEGFARVWDLRSDVRYDANEVWDLGGGLNLLRERQRWPVGGGFSGFNDNTGMSGWLEARRLAGPGEWTTTALVQDYEHLYRSARGDAPIASDDDAPQWEREARVVSAYSATLGEHQVDIGIEGSNRRIQSPDKLIEECVGDTQMALFAQDAWRPGRNGHDRWGTTRMEQPLGIEPVADSGADPLGCRCCAVAGNRGARLPRTIVQGADVAVRESGGGIRPAGVPGPAAGALVECLRRCGVEPTGERANRCRGVLESGRRPDRTRVRGQHSERPAHLFASQRVERGYSRF